MKFLDVEVKTALIVHGFDSTNKPIEEKVSEENFVRKLVALDRIRSVSEQYILVTSTSGREMYWEYKGTLEELKLRLQEAHIEIA